MRLLFVTLILASTAATAGTTYDLKHRFGIGAGAGWAIPVLGNDFDDLARDDLTYNFHARYHTSAADSLQFNYQDYDFANTDVGANVYDLMWIHRVNEYDKLTPILRLGAGVADMNNIAPYRDNLKFAGRAGVGMEYALTDDLFASATVDYQYIGKMPNNSDSSDAYRDKVPGQEIHAVVPQVNLTLFFGHDKEMNEGKAADPQAASAASATAANPNAMTTAAMDPSLMDADKDGIVDGKDKCPGSDAGAAVNAYGCVAEEKANMQLSVLFGSGSSTLTGTDAGIAEFAAFLKEHPETKAEIQGHTDNTGNPAKNKTLSQQRADAVKAALVEKYQIEPGRLSSYGYGDTQPVSDNNTPKGRSENRRVMAVISQ